MLIRLPQFLMRRPRDAPCFCVQPYQNPVQSPFHCLHAVHTAVPFDLSRLSFPCVRSTSRLCRRISEYPAHDRDAIEREHQRRDQRQLGDGAVSHKQPL